MRASQPVASPSAADSLSLSNPPPPRVTPDNHDLISMKLYQLTVHRTPEEEEVEAAEAALEFPRVDHMEQYRGKTSPPSLDPSEEGDEQASRMGAASFAFFISINRSLLFILEEDLRIRTSPAPGSVV